MMYKTMSPKIGQLTGHKTSFVTTGYVTGGVMRGLDILRHLYDHETADLIKPTYIIISCTVALCFI